MTERHFILEGPYLVRIRSYGNHREWAVYQEGLVYGPYLATGKTDGPIAAAKRAAHNALDKTLDLLRNPLSAYSRRVLTIVSVATGLGFVLAGVASAFTTPSVLQWTPVDLTIAGAVPPGTYRVELVVPSAALPTLTSAQLAQQIQGTPLTFASIAYGGGKFATTLASGAAAPSDWPAALDSTAGIVRAEFTLTTAHPLGDLFANGAVRAAWVKAS